MAQNGIGSEAERKLTIILPTNKGRGTFTRALRSVLDQKGYDGPVEVIVVLNGEAADFQEEGFRERSSRFELVVDRIPESSASRARNHGLRNATGAFVTFLDDDDELERGFIARAMQSARDDQIVLMPMVEVDSRGIYNEGWRHAKRQRFFGGKAVPACLMPWALGYNACKVLPATIAKELRYPLLESGEDVVFFANLLKLPFLRIHVVEPSGGVNYVRHLSPKSISRGRESNFSFNVKQRIQVIELLKQIDVPLISLPARRVLEKSQRDMIVRYFREAPRSAFLGIQNCRELPDKGYPRLRILAFLYCFIPFADSSGIVAAKRLAGHWVRADVVYADLASVRSTDKTLEGILGDTLGHQTKLRVPVSFGSWFASEVFGLIGALVGVQLTFADGPFTGIYSRSNWPASHLAALFYRALFPGTFWVAEFSDPLRIDISGRERRGKRPRGLVAYILRQKLRNEMHARSETTYDLIEASTLNWADTLVFTNINQAELTLGQYREDDAGRFRSKMLVAPQPIPPSRWVRSGRKPLNRSRFSIGYFGSIDGRPDIRLIGELIDKMGLGPQIGLDVYSSQSAPGKAELSSSSIIYHAPLGYLEFLRAASQYDLLIVADTDTRECGFEVNPYLPSKLSDYLGANSNIWGIVEPGSPMSVMDFTYTSYIGDPESHQEVLESIYGGIQGSREGSK